MYNEKFNLSAAEQTLLPSDDDIAFYMDHGWYISKKILSVEEIKELEKASELYYQGHRDHPLPLMPEKAYNWQPQDGNIFRQNNYVFHESKIIREILSKPIIAAIAAKLAQTDQIRLFNSTMRYKPPGVDAKTNTVGWHIDRHYWQTCTSTKMLTAFIPLHDCDTSHGTLEMIDKSHKWFEAVDADDSTTLHFARRNIQELDVLLEENAKANKSKVVKVPMLLEMGQMSFHNCLTYHGSGANLSERARHVITLNFQDKDNEFRVYHLKSGRQLSYTNDELCRKNIQGYPDYSDPMICPVLWEQQ